MGGVKRDEKLGLGDVVNIRLDESALPYARFKGNTQRQVAEGDVMNEQVGKGL